MSGSDTADNTALMAHLLRRAGFGATRDELEGYLSKGYEEVVEELLRPQEPHNLPDDLVRRYHPEQSELRLLPSSGAYWMYRMITTNCPMEEKITLFWHGLFATGYAKGNQARALLNQIDMFRRGGLGNFRDLLLELSKDPSMLHWLDNNENHKDAVNENYGRELLELFAMGIGNYTEEDVKEASRAFTGWTLGNAEYMAIRAFKDSIWPYSRIAWFFEYRDYDHDDGEKTFLGETGRFNGEDIIDIIVKQEATAHFICTRLFQFFAADAVDEAGKSAVQDMMQTYFGSGYEIRSVLQTLFNSDYFKSKAARYARVKGPVELMVGAMRLAGSYQTPTLGIEDVTNQSYFMGQGLLRPPTVEGWHEGVEWIDSGSLVERINFAAKELSDPTKDGVQDIIRRVTSGYSDFIHAENLVDSCLDFMGPIQVGANTREGLIEFAESQGNLQLKNGKTDQDGSAQVARLIGMIASTREYQLA